jgi:hypothetical protein
MLAHLRRRWSLSGREGFEFLLIQHFLENETPIFHCAGREETEANGGHRDDRTLNQTRSQHNRMHPVSVSEQRKGQLVFLTGASDASRDRRIRSTWRGAASAKS